MPPGFMPGDIYILITEKIREDIILEGLAKKIEQILFNFTRQELGNRLSEFSTLALKEIILNEIKNYKPVKSEVVKDVKK